MSPTPDQRKIQREKGRCANLDGSALMMLGMLLLHALRQFTPIPGIRGSVGDAGNFAASHLFVGFKRLGVASTGRRALLYRSLPDAMIN